MAQVLGACDANALPVSEFVTIHGFHRLRQANPWSTGKPVRSLLSSLFWESLPRLIPGFFFVPMFFSLHNPVPNMSIKGPEMSSMMAIPKCLMLVKEKGRAHFLLTKM